jgi:hypothetical protein
VRRAGNSIPCRDVIVVLPEKGRMPRRCAFTCASRQPLPKRKLRSHADQPISIPRKLSIDSINYLISQEDFFPVYPLPGPYIIQTSGAPKSTTKEFQQGEKVESIRHSRDSRLET